MPYLEIPNIASITRETFDASKNFKNVIFQKGRPVLDSELNEAQSIINSRVTDIKALLRNFFLDNAFKVVSSNEDNNFSIMAGRCNVSGVDARTSTFKYADQVQVTDHVLKFAWGSSVTVPALTTPTANRSDLVVLSLIPEQITSAEDGSLVNENLGSETAIRWRVTPVITVLENYTGAVEDFETSFTYYNAGEVFRTVLARVDRVANVASIQDDQITDLRSHRVVSGTDFFALFDHEGNLVVPGKLITQGDESVFSSTSIKITGNEIILNHNLPVGTDRDATIRVKTSGADAIFRWDSDLGIWVGGREGLEGRIVFAGVSLSGQAHQFLRVAETEDGYVYSSASLLDLSDFPKTYTDMGGRVLKVNAAGTGVVFDRATFLGLEDTPASYAGRAGQAAFVNAEENGMALREASIFDLKEMPNNFLNSSMKYLRVSEDETGIVFASGSAGGSTAGLLVYASVSGREVSPGVYRYPSVADLMTQLEAEGLIASATEERIYLCEGEVAVNGVRTKRYTKLAMRSDRAIFYGTDYVTDEAVTDVYQRTDIFGNWDLSLQVHILGSVYVRNISNDFVTRWSVSLDAVSGKNRLQLPLSQYGGFDFEVDWGDGYFSRVYQDDDPLYVMHDYLVAGDYNVTIRGSCDGFGYSDGVLPSSTAILRDVISWGRGRLHNRGGVFENCSTLTGFSATGSPSLTGITNFSRMFKGCVLFNGNLNSWDVKDGSDYSQMFMGCSSYNQPMGDWDTQGATNYSDMFNGCIAFNSDVPQYADNVTDFTRVFYGCTAFNTAIPWLTPKATTYESMFEGATSFNKYMSLDPFGATNFKNMFKNATSFNNRIFSGYLSGACDCTGMFWGASSFNSDINSWSFSGSICDDMFRDAISFNQSLSGWVGNKFASTHRMFFGAKSFNQNIDSWGTQPITFQYTAKAMFIGSPLTYSPPSWYRKPLIITVDTNNVGGTEANQFRFPLYSPSGSVAFSGGVYWGEDLVASSSEWIDAVFDENTELIHTYNSVGVYDVAVDASVDGLSCNQAWEYADQLKIVEIKNWMSRTAGETVFLKIAEGGDQFRSCANLRISATNVPVTCNTASIKYTELLDYTRMFYGCTSLAESDKASLNLWVPVHLYYQEDCFKLSGLDLNEPSWYYGYVEIKMTSGNTASGVNYSMGIPFTAVLPSGKLSQDFPVDMRISCTSSDGTVYSDILLTTPYLPLNSRDVKGDWILKSNNENTLTVRIHGMSQHIGFGSGTSTWKTTNFTAASDIQWEITDWGRGGFSYQYALARANLRVLCSATRKFNNHRFLGNEYAWNPSYFFTGSKVDGSLSCWDMSEQTCIAGIFNNCSVTEALLKSVETWDVSNVVVMADLFYYAVCPTTPIGILDLKSWDTSKLVILKNTFSGMNLPVDVSNWNTSEVTNMRGVFEDNRSFTCDISSWITSKVIAFTKAFNGCTQFNQDLSSWNTDNVIDMSEMFRGCTSFNQPLNSWNVSKVLSFSYMFYGCTVFNRPLNLWTLSTVDGIGKAIVMQYMFYNCVAFNQPLASWDVSRVISFESMFYGCTSFNSSLANWKPGLLEESVGAEGTNLTSMFQGCTSFNQPLNSWDVSKVAHISSMFRGCVVFNQPLNLWNMAKARSFGRAFYGCTSFNGDISTWNFQQGIYNASAFEMFYDCENFNQPLNSWNVGHITNMASMFYGCKLFNQDLSSWRTTYCTNMSNMFNGCLVFNGDVTTWSTGSVTNMSRMFQNCRAFNRSLSSWDVSKVTDAICMFAGCILYNSPLTWTLSLVTNATGMFEGCSVLQASNISLNMPVATNISYMFQNSTGNTSAPTISLGTTLRTLNASFMFYNSPLFNGDVSNIDVSMITNFSEMFRGCVAFAGTGIETWNVSRGLTFNRMFGVSLNTTDTVGGAFNGNVTNWTPTAGTTFAYMFQGQMQFNRALNWSMSAATDVSYMLRSCNTFNSPVTLVFGSDTVSGEAMLSNCSVFNSALSITGKLRNMPSMFSGCTAFNQSLSSLDTSEVTTMSSAFRSCTSFNQPLNSWNVSKVTSMASMFEHCTVFNQPLNSWDVSKVTNMSCMFQSCAVYNQNLSGWNVTLVSSWTNIFTDTAMITANKPVKFR